mgnify:CR=1 FL=1
MRFIYFSILIVFFIKLKTTAQNVPHWNWTRDVLCSGTTNSSNGFSLHTDAGGNIFVAGYFQGTINLGSTVHTATSSNDALIIKYNPQGNVIWSASAHGTGMENATCITTDASGNVYVAGNISSNATFGSLTATNLFTGWSQIFFAKYDPNGNIIWVKTCGGQGNDYVEDIDMDEAGNIYLAGNFAQTAIFGALTAISAGGQDAFIAKFDTAGNAIWLNTNNAQLNLLVQAPGAAASVGTGVGIGTST